MSDGEVRVAVRWQDIDGLGHVNHVMFLTYLEEGRDTWLRRHHGICRDEYVVGRCTVHYRREILPEVETVRVRTAVAEVGRSSLTTSQLMLDEDGNVLAEAEFALVLWDPRERRSRPLSDEERQSLEENMEAMR
jgi:YbgC/YbaW family acyl-CoA thioester hydrolase